MFPFSKCVLLQHFCHFVTLHTCHVLPFASTFLLGKAGYCVGRWWLFFCLFVFVILFFSRLKPNDFHKINNHCDVIAFLGLSVGPHHMGTLLPSMRYLKSTMFDSKYTVEKNITISMQVLYKYYRFVQNQIHFKYLLQFLVNNKIRGYQPCNICLLLLNPCVWIVYCGFVVL